MATVSERIYSAQDLLRMSDNGFRYELLRGQLVKMSPAGQQHGRIAATITASLGQHVTEHKLGAVYAAETGFLLATNPDHVRAPDVAFVCRERLQTVQETEGYWPGAPDLAVEVVSPGDTYAEVEDKVFDWLEAGGRLVIVVNPRKRLVTVYRSKADIVVLGEGDVLEEGEVVPGWSVPVRALFA
ncbi:MAG: Uma2 family endonuclease [Gammaproteobacteria bacterium]